MRKQTLKIFRLGLILAVAPATVACATARGVEQDARSAANTAGNAVQAVFTDQGAEAVVQGSIADVERRTRAVLQQMGLAIADVEYDDGATEREFVGRSGDRTAHVKLEARSPSTTEVNASYRVGTADYDREEARNIIARIQQR